MRNIARLPENDRRELFRNTADKMGLNDAIVEKDFWVCFTLDYLFHRCPWRNSITFKGGTSLSKAFNLISRFSEDIDLILDWRVLGYGKDEPWEKRSNTKQDAFNKEANARAEVFLAEQFCPTIKAELSQELSCEANIYIDEKDKHPFPSPVLPGSRARMWARALSSPMLPCVWRARLSCWPASSSRCLRHPRQPSTPMRRQFRWYGAISENWSLICWFLWAL